MTIKSSTVIANNWEANNAKVNKTLRDYAMPSVNESSLSIWRLATEANNVEINPSVIQMIEQMVQPGGLS